MRTARTTLLALVAGLLLACGPAGSGDVVSEPRDIGSFTGIEVSGGIDLLLVVDPDAPVSVTVVYDENLLDLIETEVIGSTLEIERRGSISFVGDGRRVEVTTPVLEMLGASGGSDIAGSGSLDELELAASGGSDVDLSDLSVASMTIDISGGSDARVNVTGEISGGASGGSDIRIIGDPSQNLDVSGGSDVSSD